MLDEDLQSMSREELQAELIKVRNAIRTHRDQKGDDNCWLDDQFYLYGLLPDGTGSADPQLPDKQLMMMNCERYYECRKAGKLYIPLKEMPVREPDGYKAFGKAFTKLTPEELKSMVERDQNEPQRNDS